MLMDILRLIPSMILVVFSMMLFLHATGIKYSKKTTIMVIIPFLTVLIFLHLAYFSPYGINFFDNWSVISVTLPQIIVTLILSKRKFLHSIVAVINAYVAFYAVILLKNIISPGYTNIYVDIIVYLLCMPILYFYISKFYKPLHNEIEAYIPKYLLLVAIYSSFFILQFYFIRDILQRSPQSPIKFEMIGGAMIFIYILSISFFKSILKHYRLTFIRASEKEALKQQLNTIVEQYKVKDEKDHELMILRHDMKHILIATSSLIKEKRYDEAISVIDTHINVIENTRFVKYTKDPVINSIISYYKNICITNNINLKIRTRNIEPALNIDSSEVAVLISNLFDNAINATKKISKNRLIEFKFINTDGKLILQMKNNYDGKIALDKNNLPTSYQENHGFGTQSINSFCKKYNLSLNYEIDNDVFILSILF